MVSETLTDPLKQSIEAAFLQHGIEPKRLFMSGKTNLPDFLAIVKTVDVALDTFPYNGGTTSLHTLWMGVPIVSLKTEHEFGKAGFALLASVELQNLCAISEQEYMETAVALASDGENINHTRKILRTRLLQSMYLDSKKITEDVESAYRSMWNKCTNKLINAFT